MKAYIVLLAGLVVLAGCVSDFEVEEEVQEPVFGSEWTLCDADNRPEVCTREYMPVCGDNNETYSNGCVACSNESVTAHKPGACSEEDSLAPQTPPEAPTIPDVDHELPVEEADLPQVASAPRSAVVCDTNNRPEFCTMHYAPVCGSDGETYGNGCAACSSADVEWHVQGECSAQAVDFFDEADACGADDSQGYVGQPLSALDAELVADARVIRPGDAVTMDYRPSRLNVYLDANDVITRIVCG